MQTTPLSSTEIKIYAELFTFKFPSFYDHNMIADRMQQQQQIHANKLSYRANIQKNNDFQHLFEI